ncbi:MULTISPECIES: phage antirepressor KilAC domain-containing protein [Allobaculum]|uniref:phage antirepressor KilAC domain-containing protein n=1 Tax=Allobaculum TaxID=174708 RepID=UPI001E55C5D8|nr:MULTISPECIES: phage antirepressor KilAC domain-containing protein [Allobaculum]UNT92206.1 phage antirepressor KilAC domain-containing protein [Allobaculum sp. Allo2]
MTTNGYRWIWTSKDHILAHNPAAPDPWVLWSRDRDGDPCNGIYGQTVEEAGLFEIKETAIHHNDGHVSINKTTKVTGKGQQYFINRLVGDTHATQN